MINLTEVPQTNTINYLLNGIGIEYVSKEFYNKIQSIHGIDKATEIMYNEFENTLDYVVTLLEEGRYINIDEIGGEINLDELIIELESYFGKSVDIINNKIQFS